MQFFDTHVLVYRQNIHEPVKQEQARRIINNAIANGEFTTSVQVLQEFYSAMLHQGWLTPAAALALMHHWAEHEVVNANAQTVFRACELQQRYQWSVWDALVVQAALDARCTTLYSEELPHGMTLGTLTITNPFFEALAPTSSLVNMPPTSQHAVHEPAASYAPAKKDARKQSS